MAKDPNAPKASRGRPKADKTKEAPKIESALLNHLRFVSIASRDGNEPYQEHCVIENKTLIAFDGVLTAGVMIEEDISACPNTIQLMRAIDRTGSKFAATIEADKLSIKGDRFRVNVQVMPPDTMYRSYPDAWAGPMTNDLKEALKACSAFASDSATTVLVSSILLTPWGTCVGTDRNVILEYRHGQQTPQLVIPRAAAIAVAKCDFDLVGFGFSNSSMTFFFEGNRFIKTQLYSEPWPENWHDMMPQGPNVIPEPTTLNEEFWKAYDTIADFSMDGFVRLSENQMRTARVSAEGATHELTDWEAEWCIATKRLKMIRPYVLVIGEIREGVLGFFGEKVRGIVALNKEEPEERAPEPAETQQNWGQGGQTGWGSYPTTGQGGETAGDGASPGIADAYAQVQPETTGWGTPIGTAS